MNSTILRSSIPTESVHRLVDISVGDYNLRTISQLFINIPFVWTFSVVCNDRKITISCQQESLVYKINEFFFLYFVWKLGLEKRSALVKEKRKTEIQ